MMPGVDLAQIVLPHLRFKIQYDALFSFYEHKRTVQVLNQKCTKWR